LARNDATISDLSDLDPEKLPRRYEMGVSRRGRYADYFRRVCERDRADTTVTEKV
jgi:hypothetical protein